MQQMQQQILSFLVNVCVNQAKETTLIAELIIDYQVWE